MVGGVNPFSYWYGISSSGSSNSSMPIRVRISIIITSTCTATNMFIKTRTLFQGGVVHPQPEH